MNRSENIDKLAEALAKAQAAMTNVTKASKAKIATKAGGEYSYTYADLGDVCEMIRKPLADNGLAIMQAPAVTSNAVEVETILAHVSGQWASCTVGMLVNTSDPKAIGSGITYARRYGMALLGVVTDDDDDAGAASKRTQPAARPQPQVVTAPAPTNGNNHDADAEFDKLPVSPASAAAQSPHWINSEASRKKFWAWCKERQLSDADVHSILGVQHMADYPGSAKEACEAIVTYQKRTQAAA